MAHTAGALAATFGELLAPPETEQLAQIERWLAPPAMTLAAAKAKTVRETCSDVASVAMVNVAVPKREKGVEAMVKAGAETVVAKVMEDVATPIRQTECLSHLPTSKVKLAPGCQNSPDVV